MTKRQPRAGTLCSIKDCPRAAAGPGCGLGYCAKHYQRWRLNGTQVPKIALKGEGHTNQVLGYREIRRDGVKVYEHIAVAEKALGKKLPAGAVVHHVTENRADNHGWMRLVICPNQAYHRLIHKLMKQKGISFKTGWPREEGDLIPSPRPRPHIPSLLND